MSSMGEVVASAPGKVILFGEHAVVYGQPALAVPVKQVTAVARIAPAKQHSGLTIWTDHFHRRVLVRQSTKNPLSIMARLVLKAIKVADPDADIVIQSSIPVASGLGSGAAVSAALGKALSRFMGVDLPTPQLNDLVYEVERFYHGNPSGIDNTVVCYEKAVFFAKGSNPATFTPIRPFAIVIADTGHPASTKVMVGKVRAGWKKDQDYFNRIFSEIGNIVLQARSIIESGNPDHLGPLMVANHELLKHLDVSSPELDHLVDTALKSGALGAKLSGGGGGGNLIALVNEDTYLNVTEALYQEGAVRVIHTEI